MAPKNIDVESRIHNKTKSQKQKTTQEVVKLLEEETDEPWLTDNIMGIYHE
ncbi:MAG: hypothetical protein M3297_16080 [Thermoproteota archaeon]|jgi:hypothetical protein|nr:hypothetical protein [Thermoproteota archaeon]